MTPAAMTCAAFLLGYSGPLPDYAWIDAKPGRSECERALSDRRDAADAAWFREAFDDPTCFAVTYTWRRSTATWTPDWAVIVADRSQPFHIFVIEGMRAINARRGVRMASRDVYALADRWRECP